MTASIEVSPYSYNVDSSAWVPLEKILSSFLDILEQRRIIAVPNGADFSPWEDPEWGVEDSEFYTPWIFSLEDDKIVDDTLAAWNGLLTAIESRIPGFKDSDYITYDSHYVNQCEIKGFFISKFVRKARIPKFRYVAPGLRLSKPEELAEQPFLNLDVTALVRHGEYVSTEYKRYPFLFLRADRKLSNEERAANSQPRRRPNGKYYEYPWDKVPEYETGVYLQNNKTVQRADGFKFLLPFPIASNNRARYSDLRTIHDIQTYDGLYQQGRSMIPETGSHRLESLLRNWTNMIEQGHWQVDENGVTGGIEKFKEADTPDKYNLYIVERTW
jgi:hypothetical protein